MSRKTELDLLRSLAACREEHGVQVIRELLVVLLEQGKTTLVRECTPANFPIVQGQAKAYDTLLNMIDRPVPELPDEAKKKG